MFFNNQRRYTIIIISNLSRDHPDDSPYRQGMKILEIHLVSFLSAHP